MTRCHRVRSPKALAALGAPAMRAGFAPVRAPVRAPAAIGGR